MSRLCLLVSVSLVALSSPVSAEDKFLDDWLLFGSARFQGDFRNSVNNFAGFGNNNFDSFVELDVRFSRDLSPYSSITGSFFGGYDDSEFRGLRDGIVAERFFAKYQQGDSSLPHRVEVGDFFGFTTLRTLQAPLKGGRIEFQHVPENSNTLHSGQFFAGSRVFDYHQLAGEDFDDNLHVGYSHLAEFKGGSAIFTGLWNQHEVLGISTNSALFSGAGEKSFDFLGHYLTLEGEISLLTGETTDGITVTEDTAFGQFAQLSGHFGNGWGYSLRYEDYGESYRPLSTAIVGDRRFLEGTFTGRFNNGLHGEVRVQKTTDAISTANSVDNLTIGYQGGLSYIPGLKGASLSLGAFFQDIENEDRSIANETLSTNAALNFTLSPKWTGTTQFLFTNVTSEEVALPSQTFVEGNATLNRSINFKKLQGVISPGVLFRNETVAGNEVFSYGLQFGANLFSENGHSVSANTALLHRNSNGAGIDTIGVNGALRYNYTKGAHSFGVEADYLSNFARPGLDGEAYRLSFNYSFAFSKPKSAATPDQDGISRYVPYRPGTLFVGDMPDLAVLPPGTPLDRALEKLATLNQGGGVVIGNNRVFEGRFIKGLGQRQRLVLENDGNRVLQSSIVIEFAPGSTANRRASEYARILEKITAHYGAPERSIDDGVFNDDLEQAVANGTFRRITEWRLQDGILRFGIPRRLDGVVRMELQYAQTHPNIAQSTWSVEEIR